ncbi:MAG: hypothetical protein M1831_002830 [Alyxoria varia]|nr:MAG: hypothetical protein M1831_002830 [Alyxoria varia]
MYVSLSPCGQKGLLFISRLLPSHGHSVKSLNSFIITHSSSIRGYATENESRAAETAEEAEDAASNLGDKFNETTQKAKDAAATGAEEARDTAQGLSDSVRNEASSIANTTEEAAEGARDMAKDAASKAKPYLRETASQAQEATSYGSKKLSSTAQDAASSAKPYLRETASQAQEATSSGARKLSDTAQDAADEATATPAESSSPDTSTPANSSLYVGNLFFEVKADDLMKLFSPYGEIEECKVITDARGLSKGFGYVTFGSKEDAEAARSELNQKVVEGRTMIVGRALKSANQAREQSSFSRPSSPPSRTLFVGNMSYEMTDKDLNALFRDVKGVIEVRVAIDRRTGQPRGFAHVDFASIDTAKEAVEFLGSKEYYGRRLKIDYSTSSRLRPK